MRLKTVVISASIALAFDLGYWARSGSSGFLLFAVGSALALTALSIIVAHRS